MKIYLKPNHVLLAITASIILIACTSCSGIRNLATATPPPKEIDIDSATMVEFPESWPKLRAGMGRQEFSEVQFVKPWRQLVVETFKGTSIEKAVYSFDFYEYTFVDNSLTEESAENNCQYFSDKGGVYKAFFPVSISRAKEMLVNSAKPLGFTFDKDLPNNISSMAWGNRKVYYAPLPNEDYERYIYKNEPISNSASSANGNNLQYKQVLDGLDFSRGNGLKRGKMVGGASPRVDIRYDGILFAEFQESDSGTIVYIETDSRYLVFKSRAISFAKSILMHMDCKLSGF